MDTFVALLSSVWYLVLLAAISPVMILNASVAVHGQEHNYGWAFVSGAGLVIGAIGITSFGLLGNGATDFASRQLASHTVDRVLGILLFLFGCHLAWKKWGSHRVQTFRRKKSAGPRSTGFHGMFTWGALGMATNFTTIPLFISSSQRIGTAALPLIVRILTFIVSWWIVLIPAWLPVVVDRVRPNSSGISGRTRERVNHWTSIASIITCLCSGIIIVATTL
ncbi:hypothetical protein O6R08_04195 [Cutibacterium equinum]|uniref:Translocator protein, LysE family n=1 Tax=Cutibacterium equinum TaxID=3016342 RepID=A0ABY7R075_9ACTN|nr:hypothetical protein [Cutibacterium equinum]WCC80691.1 hypothetical protein O6R08_04195 [Cutibacterium equinum]